MKLPVIQDKNLLVVITFYKDETDYQSKLKLWEGNIELQGDIKKLVKHKETLISYPTENHLVRHNSFFLKNIKSFPCHSERERRILYARH